MVHRGCWIGRPVQAPDPPNAWRRLRLRARRAARLPPHSKGVGFRFQALATCSNQVIISSVVLGWCPSRARRLRIRCMDSDILSHEPPKGVYRGMTPFWISHSTMLGVLWPERLSQINNARRGGRSLGSGTGLSSPMRQISHTARLVSGAKSIAGGSTARISLHCCFSQGWRTALVQLVTPLIRTCPLAG